MAFRHECGKVLPFGNFSVRIGLEHFSQPPHRPRFYADRTADGGVRWPVATYPAKVGY
jgi:hypothetical protein